LIPVRYPWLISLIEISVRDTWTPSGCSAIPVTLGIREGRRLLILVTSKISWRRCASVVSYCLCVIVLRVCVSSILGMASNEVICSFCYILVLPSDLLILFQSGSSVTSS
jgi:hypothetical protein